MFNSFEFLSTGTKKQQQKNKQIIQDNLQKIVKYLDSEDILSVKLTCRPFYYYFVTAQLWLGLKLNIAQQKLQYFDEFDFQETETKQITKKDKNIRIHSLKKQTQQQVKRLPKRQASNIKQKGKVIKQNNQLLFRNTEIGFKRLLKSNSRKKTSQIDFDIKEVDIPKITNLNDYIIKINDPWSTNMNKAQNLINLFKKLNQFHNKYISQLKIPSKQLGSLVKKLKKHEQKNKLYNEVVFCQPYSSIIASTQGAKQNLLIDQQLNKICRLFWKYHDPMITISKKINSFIQILQKQTTRINSALEAMNSKQSVKFIQYISVVDESVENCTVFLQNNKQIGQILVAQVIIIFYNMIENMERLNVVFEDTYQQIRIDMISWGTLVKKPFFSQTLFQILVSLTTKLIKICSSMCPQDLSLSIVINKVKGVKQVSQSLSSIAKYFGKLKRQIQEKEKKTKDSKTPGSIKQFVQFYSQRENESLYLTKNTAKMDKIMCQFKQKIASLKNKIQAQ